DALRALERAANFAPGNIRAHLELARLYRKMGRIGDAIAEIELAKHYGEPNRDAKLLLAQLYVDKGSNLELAEKYLNELTAGGVVDPEAMKAKVRLFMFKKDFGAAGRVVEQLEEVFPEDEDVRRLKAELADRRRKASKKRGHRRKGGGFKIIRMDQ
ncbi:MAG: hypothetical protein D6806_00050, partial [Deltaproteobacteria bacterium]